ncbi:DUF4190 domain-containing protein [Antrihabitans sp. YC3-6]|uniref:DUF4190 domain-containing protein n=1 Tax=Antrihabitans stalagmiti TaxID=2799499 RepID=A0A934NR55_9NOCA|nr:DUF4190 domain-containing protein [Antrihabitans stalagmiti]MBJ8339898.1 DUF4190 domain-containing protein [Antrihabitans stalagmiti]
MSQPPYDPYGQPSDPYNPYGQPTDPYKPVDPYATPDPYAAQYGQSPAPYGAPYGQQQPMYGQPAPAYGYPAQKTNGMAIASLVSGLVGIALCGLTSILGIIFGHIAQSQIKRTGEQGEGMALAGLILSYIVTVGWIIIWVFYIGLLATIWGIDRSTTNTY